jgi:DNA-binding transcriptional ArsR family regulator
LAFRQAGQPQPKGCGLCWLAFLCNQGLLQVNDRIEKRIELKTPVSRGQITHPGYELAKWEGVLEKMEPERLFSFTGQTYSVDPTTDYSKETPTIVEFRLERTETGTLVLVTESGFDKMPSNRRLEAFRRNDGGWTEQIKIIESYVVQRPQRHRREVTGKALVVAALGEETRLALVAKLCRGQPSSISQLTEGSKLTRQAITKHLRVLEGAGIVHGVPSGGESRSAFDPQPIGGLREYLDRVSAEWDQALARLKSFVEQ